MSNLNQKFKFVNKIDKGFEGIFENSTKIIAIRDELNNIKCRRIQYFGTVGVEYREDTRYYDILDRLHTLNTIDCTIDYDLVTFWNNINLNDIDIFHIVLLYPKPYVQEYVIWFNHNNQTCKLSTRKYLSGICRGKIISKGILMQIKNLCINVMLTDESLFDQAREMYFKL